MNINYLVFSIRFSLLLWSGYVGMCAALSAQSYIHVHISSWSYTSNSIGTAKCRTVPSLIIFMHMYALYYETSRDSAKDKNAYFKLQIPGHKGIRHTKTNYRRLTRSFSALQCQSTVSMYSTLAISLHV